MVMIDGVKFRRGEIPIEAWEKEERHIGVFINYHVTGGVKVLDFEMFLCRHCGKIFPREQLKPKRKGENDERKRMA